MTAGICEVDLQKMGVRLVEKESHGERWSGVSAKGGQGGPARDVVPKEDEEEDVLD